MKMGMFLCAFMACTFASISAQAGDDSVAPNQGSEQSALNQLISTDVRKVEAAPNNMAADGLMDTFGKDICARINGMGAISGWTGTVESINSDGTFNILSEPFTISGQVSENSPVFKKLSLIKQLVPVRISGIIIHNESDCTEWASLTSLNLVLKLTDIQGM